MSIITAGRAHHSLSKGAGLWVEQHRVARWLISAEGAATVFPRRAELLWTWATATVPSKASAQLSTAAYWDLVHELLTWLTERTAVEQQHASSLGKVVGKALKEIDATASTAPHTLVAIVKCVDVALSLITLPFADMLSALERVCTLLSSTCSTSESAAAAALAEPLGALLVLVVNDVRRQLPRQRNRKKVYASVVSKVLTDLLKIRSVLLAADIAPASSATAAGNGTATAGTNTATGDSTRASPALLDGLLADVLMDGEHIAPYRLAVVERKWQVDSEDDAEESDAGDEDASDAEGDATMKFSLSDDEDKGDGSGAAKAGESHEAAGGGGSATIETKTRKKEKQKKKEKAAKKKAGFSYPRQLFDVLASTADEASGKALHVSAAQALVPLVGSFLAASGKGVFGVASRQVQFTVTVEFCNVIVGAPLGTQLWDEGRPVENPP